MCVDCQNASPELLAKRLHQSYDEQTKMRQRLNVLENGLKDTIRSLRDRTVRIEKIIHDIYDVLEHKP